MKIKALNAIDFYKADHISQYPNGCEYVYSNFTPRSSRLFQGKSDEVVFFGLQGFIKWFLIDTWNETFFKQPKEKVLADYKRRMDTSLGVNAVKLQHISDLHDLGYLPIKIKALPEGGRVGMKVPVLTITNTVKGYFWLVGYLESVMSAELWKSCTSATIAAEYKDILDKYALSTGVSLDFTALQCHDFSFRGMSGIHDAASTGAGHLTSFVGTDSVPAIDYLEEYYNANCEEELIGCSVPATEHSVMCMNSKEGEIETFKKLINETYPTGIVSIVSDTWDFWKVITEYLPKLKQDIMQRKPNQLGLNKVVIRPDSGDPIKVITGYKVMPQKGSAGLDLQAAKDAGYDCIQVGSALYIDLNGNELMSCEVKGAIQCLWETFGGTVSDNGYKILDEHIGLIYGDSITLQRAEVILDRLKQKGFASSNIVFGVGSYTYQHVTRDTFGFAMKATYGVVDGQGVEIFKSPKTDSGTKKSAKGLMRVELEDGKYVMYDQQTSAQESQGELEVVFKDGKLMQQRILDDIRNLINN